MARGSFDYLYHLSMNERWAKMSSWRARPSRSMAVLHALKTSPITSEAEIPSLSRPPSAGSIGSIVLE
jgi:hypothetical protein